MRHKSILVAVITLCGLVAQVKIANANINNPLRGSSQERHQPRDEQRIDYISSITSTEIVEAAPVMSSLDWDGGCAEISARRNEQLPSLDQQQSCRNERDEAALSGNSTYDAYRRTGINENNRRLQTKGPQGCYREQGTMNNHRDAVNNPAERAISVLGYRGGPQPHEYSPS